MGGFKVTEKGGSVMKKGNTIIGVYGTLRKGYGLNSCLVDAKFLGKKRVTIPYKMHAWGIPYLIPDTLRIEL